MNTSPSDQKDYIQQAVELYRNTPGTLDRVGREDRRLAAELHGRGISLVTLEEAFILAASRRCFRAPDAPPLAPIRSMHYFIPVIEEVLANPLDIGYVAYLKSKLKNWAANTNAAEALIRPKLFPPAPPSRLRRG
jgi:hypothetical protein